MKTVLMIAYYYPPVIETGARRSGCMAKYLPESGWRPLVVTRRWTPDNCMYDPDFVRNLPADRIAAEVPIAGSCLRMSLWQKIRRFVRPDTFPAPWVPRALEAIRRICEQQGPDVVWATCGPYSSLTIGASCAQEHGLPWAADLRDVPGQYGTSQDLDLSVRRLRLVPVEKRLLRSANAITTVSEGLAAIVRARHGREAQVIPNGFDPEDYGEGQPRRMERFTILYTGRLMTYYDPGPLFAALDLLHERSQIRFENVSVHFCGRSRERVAALAAPYRCSRIVACEDTVPHAKAARLQQDAAVLLTLSCPGGTGVLGSKMLEYLGARRPILSIPKDGDCVDALLRKTGAGVSCSTSEAIAQQLLAWYREWEQTGTVACHTDDDAVMEYSRRRQAGRLAEVLDSVRDAHARGAAPADPR
jgi:glycosyltransferase involved in cell wall biosynthesis